jgi:endonuclease/exonuclease/phosphatase family metal-dependent hydrolase
MPQRWSPIAWLLVALAPLWGCVPPRPADDDTTGGPSDDDATGDDDDAADDDDSVGDPAFGLLTLNLHCFKIEGTDFSTNDARFAAIADLVAAEGVAALALQEVCEREGESALGSLVAVIEDATGDEWSSAWAFSHVAWEGTEDQADEGVALAVRGALADEAVTTYHAQSALQRVGLSATLPADLGGLRLHTLHLENAAAAVREAQARQAATTALAERDSLGVLVAGDLNDVEGSAVHQAFLDMGFDDLSDGLGATRIDHVMAHRRAWVVPLSALRVFDGGDSPVVSDHPGVLVRLEPTEVVPTEITRITAHVDVGWGHHLAVRGDTAPLSWEQGWPAWPAADGRWVLVLTELPKGMFEYKVLIDDENWQAGDNVLGEAGADNETTPEFE